MSQQEDYSSFFGREDKPIESEPELEAYREKIITTERMAAGIRGLIIVLNAIIYFLLTETGYFQPDKIDNHATLAYVVLGLSFIYSCYTYLVKPGEHYPVMYASYFSYVSDIVFITLWLYATGGYASPFYILWYVAVVTVAYRFNWRIVWVTSVLYIVSYVSLLLVLSHVHTAGQLAELTLRCAYIVAVGYVASLIAKETYEQTKEKLQIKNITRNLMFTQRELEDKKNALEELTRLLENKVTERTKDLETNARNFSLLLDSIHLLTWTTTPEGKVNYHNKAWDRFFKGTVDGNDLEAFVHPIDIDNVKRKWQHVKESGIETEGEFRWRRYDNEWRTMHVHIICLRNEENQIIMWIGTAADITQQKQ